jgi:hypothetical protein
VVGRDIESIRTFDLTNAGEEQRAITVLPIAGPPAGDR